MIYVLFGLGLYLGYTSHQHYLNGQTDTDAIAKVAIAIRREKNKRYARFTSNLPDCSVCGPGYRHHNLTPH